jgi:hypothetical protein
VANNRIETFAKYAGLATVVIEWAALLFYYLQLPLYFGGSHPISYFATVPQTRATFSICYTLAGIAFWIFAKHHLNKHFDMPLRVFGISMIFFIGMALFPFNPSSLASLLIHSSLTYSCAGLFLAGMYLTAKRSNDERLFRVTIAAIILNILLSIAFATAPAASNLVFSFEAGSWLVVQLWIIWLSFYLHNKKSVAVAVI